MKSKLLSILLWVAWVLGCCVSLGCFLAFVSCILLAGLLFMDSNPNSVSFLLNALYFLPGSILALYLFGRCLEAQDNFDNQKGELK
jgi:hypothetical protein